MAKPYVRKMPATWWLAHRAYFWFMLREFTSVFLAIYCVILLVMVWRIRHDQFDEFLAQLQNPWSVGFHFICLVAALFNTATWFALVPKVMVLRRGEEKVPAAVLVAAHWFMWLVVTAVCLVVAFR